MSRTVQKQRDLPLVVESCAEWPPRPIYMDPLTSVGALTPALLVTLAVGGNATNANINQIDTKYVQEPTARTKYVEGAGKARSVGNFRDCW